MATAAVSDAIIDVENGDIGSPVEYATWLALLDNPHNRKGMVAILLQRFHRRGGMRTFKQVNCSTEDGGPIEKPGDMADIDPHTMAHGLYEAAIADGKRQGCDTYRVQLRKLKGSGKSMATVDGDFAGLRFNVVTGEAVWGPDTGAPRPEEAWKDIAEFLRDALKDVISGHAAATTAVTGTLIQAVQLGDGLIERRIDHASRVEQMVPTPAEENERVRMGLNTLTHTAREIVRFHIWNKSGKMPPPGQSFDAGATKEGAKEDAAVQAELKTFWDSLGEDTHSKLRQTMGEANYTGLDAVLKADTETFQVNFPVLGQMLGAAIHTGRLRHILSDDEMRTLCGIFDVEPPA